VDVVEDIDGLAGRLKALADWNCHLRKSERRDLRDAAASLLELAARLELARDLSLAPDVVAGALSTLRDGLAVLIGSDATAYSVREPV
jgi:hypothetical protein